MAKMKNKYVLLKEMTVRPILVIIFAPIIMIIIAVVGIYIILRYLITGKI